MAKRKRRSASRTEEKATGSVARSGQQTLRSYTVGALPILNQILKRMKLEEFLQAQAWAAGEEHRLRQEGHPPGRS